MQLHVLSQNLVSFFLNLHIPAVELYKGIFNMSASVEKGNVSTAYLTSQIAQCREARSFVCRRKKAHCQRFKKL